jgi:hypothetical protein
MLRRSLMRIFTILTFLVSLQSFAFDKEKVDFDFLQDEKGKVLGAQTLVVYYGKCQAQRSFKFKDIQAFNEGKSGEISEWMGDMIDQMSEGGKCD